MLFRSSGTDIVNRLQVIRVIACSFILGKYCCAQWFFSIVDVVQVLTESVDGRKYWNKLKQTLVLNINIESR